MSLSGVPPEGYSFFESKIIGIGIPLVCENLEKFLRIVIGDGIQRRSSYKELQMEWISLIHIDLAASHFRENDGICRDRLLSFDFVPTVQLG